MTWGSSAASSFQTSAIVKAHVPKPNAPQEGAVAFNKGRTEPETRPEKKGSTRRTCALKTSAAAFFFVVDLALGFGGSGPFSSRAQRNT